MPNNDTAIPTEGSTIFVAHECSGVVHDDPITVTGVVKMRGIAGNYRIETTRCDGTPLRLTVDPTGRELLCGLPGQLLRFTESVTA